MEFSPEDLPEPVIAVLGVLGLLALACSVIDIARDRQVKQPTLPVWNCAWLDFFILLWAVICLAFLTQSVFFSLYPEPLEDASGAPSAWIVAIAGTLYQGSILAVLLAARFIYKRLFAFPLNSGNTPNGAGALAGVFYFFAAMPFIFLLSRGWEFVLQLWVDAGYASPPEPQSIVLLLSQKQEPLALALLVILAVGIAPVVEELLFRGFIYRFLRGKIGPRFAMVLSSLFFATIHFNLYSFIALLLLGALLTRAYEKTGSIWSPIVLHACFNASTVSVLVILAHSAPAN